MNSIILPHNHWLFQLANCLLFISYLVPSILALRLILSAACLCFTLWGLLILDISVDTTVYNGVFTIINFCQFLHLLYQRRYVKIDSRLMSLYLQLFGSQQQSSVDSFLHQLHHLIFKSKPALPEDVGCGDLSPAGSLAPIEFMELVRDSAYDHTIRIHRVQNGEVIAKPGDTTNDLRIVLSGRFVVLKQRHSDVPQEQATGFLEIPSITNNSNSEHNVVGEDFLQQVMQSSLFFQHMVPFEFIDSPEYSQRLRNSSKANRATFVVYIICDTSGEVSKALTFPNSVLADSHLRTGIGKHMQIVPQDPSDNGATYLSISYEHLDKMKMKNSNIAKVIDTLVARDITGKLFATAQSFAINSPLSSPMNRNPQPTQSPSQINPIETQREFNYPENDSSSLALVSPTGIESPTSVPNHSV
jgi:hypothetical protein